MADGVMKLLSDMRQAADMQSPECGLERALTMTGGAVDETSDSFWAQKRQQARDNTFDPGKDVVLVRYLTGKNLGSDQADLQAEAGDDFVGRMIAGLWVKPKGLERKIPYQRQRLMWAEHQLVCKETKGEREPAFGCDDSERRSNNASANGSEDDMWLMVPGCVTEVRRVSGECRCLSDGSFGDEGCKCRLQVWRVKIVKDHKGLLEANLSKEELTIDGLRRILTKAAFEIVAAALDGEGEDALRTAVIPFHWHAGHLKRSVLVKVRATAGTRTVLEGMDRHGRSHPITLDWIATAHLGTTKVALPEEWVKDMRERVAKGNTTWKGIKEGAKKRRREGSDLVLKWSRPELPLKLRQDPGEHSCYSDTAATALEIWGRLHERPELVACANKIHRDGKEIASRGSNHQTALTTDLISGIVGDWGYRFSLVDTYDPLSNLIGLPVVLRLKSSGAYPHCVAIFGNYILDPTEPRAIRLSKDNLDAICGGEGAYVGVAWAREFRRYRTSEERQASTVGNKDIPAPVQCCRKATLVAHKCTCGGGSTLVLAAAAALRDHGLVDAARKLQASALENKEEISFQPRMWLRASLTRLLAEIKSSRMGCYSLGKSWDPFEEEEMSWDMVVAEVRGHKHLYVAFVKGHCDNKMMTPSHPQWLDITEENMNFITDGEYKGLQWAMAFGGEHGSV